MSSDYNHICNRSSVEISPSLAEIQRETVGVVRSHLSKFRVECRDAADRTGWGKLFLCFLLTPMLLSQHNLYASRFIKVNNSCILIKVYGAFAITFLLHFNVYVRSHISIKVGHHSSKMLIDIYTTCIHVKRFGHMAFKPFCDSGMNHLTKSTLA